MNGTRTRAVALALSTSLLLGLTASGAQAITDAGRARTAASFVASKQRADGAFVSFSAVGSTADGVLALVAAGRGETPLAEALGYLRRQTRRDGVETIGLTAKVALAVEAAGGNAHRFGGRDLIAEIRASESKYGRFKGASVLDQALALLALRAADGLTDASASQWLLEAQCPDGGWSYDKPYAAATDDDSCWDGSPEDFFTSDTNTTAYAVMALVVYDTPAYDVFGYFTDVRDVVHGGWGYTADYPTTDANSTALVIQAYLATGAPVPAGALPALRDLRYACGAFAYSWADEDTRTGRNLGATIAAIPALERRALPFEGDVAGELPASDC